MIVKGFRYREFTGEITSTFVGPNEAFIHLQESEGEITQVCSDDVDPATERQDMLSGSVVPRALMPLVYSTDPFLIDTDWTITGIPMGTELHYPGGIIVIDDGMIAWSADEPGEYQFVLVNFPYQMEVILATVIEA